LVLAGFGCIGEDRLAVREVALPRLAMVLSPTLTSKLPPVPALGAVRNPWRLRKAAAALPTGFR